MYSGNFRFVDLSRGEYEGVAYDNIVLSDGLQSVKCKNRTGKTSFPFKRGDSVTVSFDLEFGKNDKVVLSVREVEEV